MISRNHPNLPRRLYIDYFKLSKLGDLDKYWDISRMMDYSINISVNQLDYNLYNVILNLKYPEYMTSLIASRDFLRINDIGLGMRINYMILDYIPVENTIDLVFNIKYHDNYPLSNPIWSVITAKTTMNLMLPDNYTLYDYYNYLVTNKNDRFIDINRWNPIITMEKDILDFIVFLNHYEYLVRYTN